MTLSNHQRPNGFRFGFNGLVADSQVECKSMALAPEDEQRTFLGRLFNSRFLIVGAVRDSVLRNQRLHAETVQQIVFIKKMFKIQSKLGRGSSSSLARRKSIRRLCIEQAKLQCEHYNDVALPYLRSHIWLLRHSKGATRYSVQSSATSRVCQRSLDDPN